MKHIVMKKFEPLNLKRPHKFASDSGGGVRIEGDVRIVKKDKDKR